MLILLNTSGHWVHLYIGALGARIFLRYDWRLSRRGRAYSFLFMTVTWSDCYTWLCEDERHAVYHDHGTAFCTHNIDGTRVCCMSRPPECNRPPLPPPRVKPKEKVVKNDQSWHVLNPKWEEDLRHSLHVLQPSGSRCQQVPKPSRAGLLPGTYWRVWDTDDTGHTRGDSERTLPCWIPVFIQEVSCERQVVDVQFSGFRCQRRAGRLFAQAANQHCSCSLSACLVCVCSEVDDASIKWNSMQLSAGPIPGWHAVCEVVDGKVVGAVEHCEGFDSYRSV